MSLRTVVLRIMLWSLTLAGVTGVFAVLTQGSDLTWRVVGTGLITAVACALMLPASVLMDREKSRSAGLVGMAGVILEFMMAMALVWELSRSLWGGLWVEETALTMVFVGLAALMTMCFLGLMQRPRHAIAGGVGIVIVGGSLLAYLLAVWVPYGYRAADRWYETGSAIAVLGMLILLALVGFEGWTHRPWRWLGVSASNAAGTMWMLSIWIGSGSDLSFVIFSVLVSLGAVVAHANLCLQCTVTQMQRWVRTGTIGAAMVTAGLVDLLVMYHKLYGVDLDDALLGRSAAAAGIVTACGTLSLCVLTRLNRKVDFEPLSSELVEMTVVCPRCRKKQTVRVGSSACAACGLRISLRIEEPRCPKCDYLLYRLTSDRCPECGTTIAAAPAASQ